MTNEERKALVEHLRHDADDLHDFQTAADQIEADGQRIAELEAMILKIGENTADAAKCHMARVAELEREKAVVFDLLEQQKELALEYLFDCNRAGERIAELEAALGSIARNTCCGQCQEAALVARAALGETK